MIKKIIKKIIDKIVSFFKKDVVTTNVNVTTVVEPGKKPKTDKIEKKYTVDELVELLDKVQESNDDIYTTVALLISEIKDVYEANSDTREKQKEDCYNIIKAIQDQITKI